VRSDGPSAGELLDKLHGYIREAGRRIEDVGVEARVNYANSTPDAWQRTVDEWRALGATHLGVNTMGAGLASPRDHIDAIRRVAEALPLSPSQIATPT